MIISGYSVSVIIPCFNSALTIERAIKSVQAQTYQVSEIICVDDCSSDTTHELLENFKKNDQRIKIYKNLYNSGPSYSRNLGVRQATSEFIAFLDSDDYWDVNKINIQIKVIRYFDFHLIGCRALVGDCDYSQLESFSGVKRLSHASLLTRNVLLTPSVIVKKSRALHFNEAMRYGEDYNLWLSLSRMKYKLGCIHKPLVCLGKHNYGESGLSANLFKMETGEIKSIINNSSCFESVIFVPLSILKYLRRVLLVSIRRFL